MSLNGRLGWLMIVVAWRAWATVRCCCGWLAATTWLHPRSHWTAAASSSSLVCIFVVTAINTCITCSPRRISICIHDPWPFSLALSEQYHRDRSWLLININFFTKNTSKLELIIDQNPFLIFDRNRSCLSILIASIFYCDHDHFANS